jgi:hypothetical protein
MDGEWIMSSFGSTAGAGRLARLSQAMMWVTTIGIGLIVVLTALGFLIPDWTRNALLARLGQAGSALPLSLSARLVAGAISAVPIGVMLWGLWQVRALFRDFAEGRVFTENDARRLQMFGVAVLAQAPLGPLIGTALALALSLANPPGRRLLVIAFSINDYFALIVGGVLVAVATVMREAARLADENASFV